MSQSPKSNSENNPQDSLPDLYKLLSLQPLESDHGKIERAIKGLESKAASADTKLAQKIARMVAIGRKNLLDPTRKKAYDRAWSNQYGHGTSSTEPSGELQVGTDSTPTLPAMPLSLSTSSAPTLSWDFSELELFLPLEDPHAAFDLGTYLQSSESLSEADMTADFDKLNMLLGGVAMMTTTSNVKAELVGWDFSTVDEHGQPKQKNAPTRTNAEPMQSQSAGTDEDAWLNVANAGKENTAANSKSNGTESTTKRPANAAILAKQLRKKRMQSMFLNIFGMLAALAAVFGVMYYLVTKDAKRSEIAVIDPPQPETKLQNKTVNMAKPNSLTTDVEPQGSGLPKIPGMGVEPMDADMASAKLKEPAEPTAINPAPPQPEPATPLGPVMEDMKPKTALPQPKPDPEPTPDPELSDVEKSRWAKAVESLRKALGQQDFGTSKKQLEEIKQAAKTQLQRDQLKFLVNAVAGLGAGETFKIGSTPASFVEGNANSITIKTGRLQTYKFNELPNGVAYGLVNLQMDVENPISYARKSAFAWVHPKTNALTLREAKAMMDKAVAGGAVSDDMIKIFDDDYRLGSK
jgi:hypothetical protein